MVIVPNLAVHVAGRFQPLPPNEEIEAATEAVWEEYDQELARSLPERPKPPAWMHGWGISNAKHYGWGNGALYVWDKGLRSFYGATLRPMADYLKGVSRVQAPLRARYAEKAWEDLNRYRRELLDFFREEDQRDPQSLHLLFYGRRAMSQRSVDPDLIPRFRERRRSVMASIAAVTVDVALLILLNIILFMVAYMSFMRADVR